MLELTMSDILRNGSQVRETIAKNKPIRILFKEQKRNGKVMFMAVMARLLNTEDREKAAAKSWKKYHAAIKELGLDDTDPNKTNCDRMHDGYFTGYYDAMRKIHGE